MSIQNEVLVIGVSGGSGSGKTYFAHSLVQKLGEHQCTILLQDNYYHDQSRKFDYDGGSVNFDHPESLDFNLLAQHLIELKCGKAIQMPLYDFKTHSRLPLRREVLPTRFIVVDGILILTQKIIRDLLDESVFVDTSESLRFSRRLQRDVEERGRTPEGVRAQFINQVKPMHDLFVEPSKAFASYLVEESLDFNWQMDRFINSGRW